MLTIKIIILAVNTDHTVSFLFKGAARPQLVIKSIRLLSGQRLA